MTVGALLRRPGLVFVGLAGGALGAALYFVGVVVRYRSSGSTVAEPV